MSIGRLIRNFSRCNCNQITYKFIDKSKIPVLNEDDLIEEFVKGGGPGGSNVNKTVSCVVLKHEPTGIVIKCQFHRQLHQNRVEARRILIEKLDTIINGEQSIEGQKKLIESKKSSDRIRKRRKIEEMKLNYKSSHFDQIE